MIVVNKSQVTLDKSQGGAQLVSEASALELKPGEWPDFISVVDDNNEGFLFQRSTRMDYGGEFAGYIYMTKSGMTLRVWND